jgi:hypothetical protein
MATLCLFSIPKPMNGEAERLQHNAFESWRRLGDTLQVILLGNDPGVAGAAAHYGFSHLPELITNALGTPLVSDALARVRQHSDADWLLYTNADILFDNSLSTAVAALRNHVGSRFLGIGQRLESDLSVDLRSWSDAEMSEWMAAQRRAGQWASVVCKDYFLFPRHVYQNIPDFAVGRGNWDNWMVYQAHRWGMPVIDMTAHLTAVHQPHGHNHSGGRRLAYVAGAEARENQRLARGRHLLVGSHASHYLDSQGKLKPMGWRWLPRAAKDTPRFVQLLRSLIQSPTAS